MKSTRIHLTAANLLVLAALIFGALAVALPMHIYAADYAKGTISELHTTTDNDMKADANGWNADLKVDGVTYHINILRQALDDQRPTNGDVTNVTMPYWSIYCPFEGGHCHGSMTQNGDVLQFYKR